MTVRVTFSSKMLDAASLLSFEVSYENIERQITIRLTDNVDTLTPSAINRNLLFAAAQFLHGR